MILRLLKRLCCFLGYHETVDIYWDVLEECNDRDCPNHPEYVRPVPLPRATVTTLGSLGLHRRLVHGELTPEEYGADRSPGYTVERLPRARMGGFHTIDCRDVRCGGCGPAPFREPSIPVKDDPWC